MLINNSKMNQCIQIDNDFIPVSIQNLENDRLNDAKNLAESVILLKSINNDLKNIINEQGLQLNLTDENLNNTNIILEETNLELNIAAKYKKINVGPILIGAGIGAVIFGIPPIFIIGIYSTIFATGGGILGGIIGKIVS